MMYDDTWSLKLEGLKPRNFREIQEIDHRFLKLVSTHSQYVLYDVTIKKITRIQFIASSDKKWNQINQ